MSTLLCENIGRAVLGEPVKCEGRELLWRCPNLMGHRNGDAHPSFRINTQKNVFACFPCDAKGTAWQLAAFIAGVNPSEKSAVTAWLRERRLLDGKGRAKKEEPVAEYVYTDVDGNPVARKRRYEPKSFSWQRWEDDKWLDGLSLLKPPLYRLPGVLAASDLLFVEGERDADTGTKLGFAATTSGPTGSWRPEFAQTLQGKRVTIIADADAPDRKHAQQVAASLSGAAELVKVLQLPAAKDLSEWVERGGTRDALLELIQKAPEWKPEEIDAELLLDQVAGYIRRFVSLSEAQRIVITLWAVQTHLLSATDTTAYLAITSAEKQSGKTRLLEVLQTVVANPWFTGRVTAAVLIRKIDAEQPTLLLDESDAAFGGEKEYAEALRGVLNTGYRRGGTASCVVGKGSETSFKDFSTFCAKAIAGIGKLPDTVADRSIPIRLKRTARGEDAVQKFRRRDVEQEAANLHRRIESWADQILERMRNARPQIPDELSDRQQDATESLLAIADLAGGKWPELARTALVRLCVEAQDGDDSVGYRLLSDIREVFNDRRIDKISSAELASALAGLETSPWGEWNRGKSISQAKIAHLLRPFEIISHNIRIEEKVLKGYERQDLEDAWKRYLKPSLSDSSADSHLEPATPLQANTDASLGDFSNRYAREDVAAQEREKVSRNAPCSGVAALGALTEHIGREEEL